MPLFFRKKKLSEDSQKRLEYQLCRSKEAGADDILDISACELSEVSMSTVIILLTEKLDRICWPLKVLDLHDNKLSCLPEDIGKLASLQILNVEKNRLKTLPDSIGDLRLLQTLNLKGNSLSELPSVVGSLSSLRTLDVSDNNIVQLPKTLAYIRTLEVFALDAAMMTYPPVSVCTEGTESIQRFLCSELGEEYCPPSQYLLPVLESDCGKPTDCLDSLEVAWQSKFSDYEKRKVRNSSNTLTNLIHTALSMQESCAVTPPCYLCESCRCGKGGEFYSSSDLQVVSEAGRRLCEWKSLIRTAMQKMLSDSFAMNLLQEASDVRRQSLVSEACRSLETLDKKFDKMLSLQVLDKSKAIAQILQEEEMQKAAFQALQLQKDAVHGYIRNQIKLIEGELKQLTKLEIKRRNLDAENLQEVLVEQRTALSDLLQQLLKQRDQREQELRQVLAEMERKSESNQQNYWMIQYQRLLDAKPLSLRMQEAGVEKELVNLLCKLSAQHYLPILAHHRVTTEALRHMNSSDLKKLGISEVGIQKALLKWARDYLPEGTSHTSNISLFYTLILSIQQDTKWSLMCECKQMICGHTGHNTTCDV
uniref:Leucine rich repeat and sterile alpha motif containing 1 n=1 Tax=Sparus aurata TaxID=8175 RepID=A0A671UYM6_SPAAU